MFLHRKQKCANCGEEFEWRWYGDSRDLNVGEAIIVGNVAFHVNAVCPHCRRETRVEGYFSQQRMDLPVPGHFVINMEDGVYLLYQENGTPHETLLAGLPAWDPTTATVWAEAWLMVRDSEAAQLVTNLQAIMALGMTARRLTFLRGGWSLLSLDDALERGHHFAVRSSSLPMFMGTGSLDEAKQVAEEFLSGQGL